MSKRITVYSNDPENPRLELTLKGEITLDVKVTPMVMTFGDVIIGQTPKETFDIEILEPEKVKIKAVRTEDERFVIAKLTDDGKGKSSYEITFNGAKEKNRIITKTIIELEGSDVPQLEYTLRANVVGNLKYPSHIYLLRRNGEYRTREISIVSREEGTAFKVKKVTDPNGKLNLTVTKKSPQETVVSVSMKDPKTTLKENLRGEILIKTSDPTEPEVTIRYTATTRNSASRVRQRALKNRRKQIKPTPNIKDLKDKKMSGAKVRE